MASPKTKGRMLTKDISDSKGFASLSPEAAVLFAMMVPHYSGYGKLNGDPGYIKGEICPRVPYLTIENIPEYLQEITEKTSVKWFEYEGRWWIHSIKFLVKHQKLDIEKLGKDGMPSYSGVTPELVHPEVEVEGEVKETPLVDGQAPSTVTENGDNGTGKKQKKDYPEAFNTFWTAYPRKVAKDVALKAFLRTSKEYPPEALVKSAEEYATECRTKGKDEKYILHPSTFLNDGRWKDWCFVD
jgi:hypothetical protein